MDSSQNHASKQSKQYIVRRIPEAIQAIKFLKRIAQFLYACLLNQ
jgi:hypothetical protein